MHPPVVSTRQLFSRTREDRRLLLAAVERAFCSRSAPGILLVDQLHADFARHRLQLFQGARALAALPPHQLQLLQFPHLQYSVGWSRAREKFGGVLDQRKGSFYANPIYDQPAQHAAHSHHAHHR
eukprot:TRINITY_DN131_c0_g1_i2.p4 TRINITY_DN131_c0_g1~~TRINITY_DN131_c0_g1_i2.p4  ORF type:complete len:133 (+),score=34.61 TRINITY_DN131_c0_g1_i2:25-399(+)